LKHPWHLPAFGISRSCGIWWIHLQFFIFLFSIPAALFIFQFYLWAPFWRTTAGLVRPGCNIFFLLLLLLSSWRDFLCMGEGWCSGVVIFGFAGLCTKSLLVRVASIRLSRTPW
jgi:hypothetical protein